MTEQIKSALTKWAEKVLKNESNWETEQTHAAIQRLYEISVYYKLLQEEEVQNAKKWGRHQNELKAVLDSLNPSEIEEMCTRGRRFGSSPIDGYHKKHGH